MRTLRKILATILILVLVLVVIVAAAGVVLVRRTFPQEKGSIHVAGLENQVEIYRDEWGIPTVYAHTAHDLFFAQGYVHAQDRLWQMEFSRRIAPGRLSEVLGDAALEDDRFLRTLGMGRAAQAEAERLDPSRGPCWRPIPPASTPTWPKAIPCPSSSPSLASSQSPGPRPTASAGAR